MTPIAKKKLRRIYYNVKNITHLFKNVKFVLKKSDYTFNPVFIIGCGRSGTTILGKTLAMHPAICYLNERQDLWHSAYPEIDTWIVKKAQPRLFLNEKDYDANKTRKLRRIFFREQVAADCKVLLEKLPDNNFRLNFLQACFPEAKYIYLYRNGLEVAESISKRILHF